MQGRSMVNLVLIFLCLFYAASTYAQDYYSQHETGWFWFDDSEEAQKPKRNVTSSKSKTHDPTEIVIHARKTIKRALDQAIVDPTPENIRRYIELQNQMTERANQFANTWQQVILNHPELNYSISHPTNNIALQVYHEKESKDKDNVLKKFAERSGLFFFYRSTCLYCQRFAPILKHFAQSYHIAVIPITMDGISLPEYPNSKQDNGQSKLFHVTMEPSLYAVDPETQKAFPVAFGLTSESELRENIYNIVTHYQEGLR